MPKLNLSELIRYGYGGLLLFVILLIHYPKETKLYVESAGLVLAPLVILGTGACIYVLYRHLLGEWVIYPLTHALEWLILPQNRTDHPVSPFWFLGTQGIPVLTRRDAYTSIRRRLLKKSLKEQLDFAHAEIHLIYITAIELLILGLLYPFYCANIPIWTYGVIILFVGIIADIRQHRHELISILASTSSEAIANFLTVNGYKTNDTQR